MRAHLMKILVIDFENNSDADVIYHVEENRHLCIHRLEHLATDKIEWGDDNPLNMSSTMQAEINRMIESGELKEVRE